MKETLLKVFVFYVFYSYLKLKCLHLHECVLITLLSGFYNSDSGSWMFVWIIIFIMFDGKLMGGKMCVIGII